MPVDTKLMPGGCKVDARLMIIGEISPSFYGREIKI